MNCSDHEWGEGPECLNKLSHGRKQRMCVCRACFGSFAFIYLKCWEREESEMAQWLRTEETHMACKPGFCWMDRPCPWELLSDINLSVGESWRLRETHIREWITKAENRERGHCLPRSVNDPWSNGLDVVVFLKRPPKTARVHSSQERDSHMPKEKRYQVPTTTCA